MYTIVFSEDARKDLRKPLATGLRQCAECHGNEQTGIAEVAFEGGAVFIELEANIGSSGVVADVYQLCILLAPHQLQGTAQGIG